MPDPITASHFLATEMSCRPTVLALCLSVLAAYTSYDAYSYQNGLATNKTLKPGSVGQIGCYCHCETASPSTKVQIVGPSVSAFQVGQEYDFTARVSNPDEQFAGVDIAAYSGTLTPGSKLKLVVGELTHLQKIAIPTSGAAVFEFKYTPKKSGTDTIYATGNAVNGNASNGGGNCEDAWAHAPKFIVNVAASAVAEVVGASSFKVLNNPAHDQLKVQVSGSNHEQELQLVDLAGRVTRTWKLAAGEKQSTLDVRGLRGAFYLRSFGSADSKLVRIR